MNYNINEWLSTHLLVYEKLELFNDNSIKLEQYNLFIDFEIGSQFILFKIDHFYSTK